MGKIKIGKIYMSNSVMMISGYEIKNCVLLEELISYDTHWLRSLSVQQ